MSHLRNLRTPSNSAKDLRNTYDSIERILRQLQALGENIEQAILIDILHGKFPAETLLDLQKLKPVPGPWTTAEFRDCLKQVIETMEEVQRITQNQTAPKVTKPSVPPQQSQTPMTTTGAMPATIQSHTGNVAHNSQSRFKKKQGHKGNKQSDVSTTTGQSTSSGQFVNSNSRQGGTVQSNNQFRSPPNCLFCSQAHFSSNCNEFFTVASRKAALAKRKDITVCFKCLRIGHTASNCQNTVRCYYCRNLNNNSHHSAFCLRQFPNVGSNTTSTSTTSNTAANSANVVSGQGQSNNTNTSPAIVLSSMQAGDQSNYLTHSSILSTAKVQLRNRNDPIMNESVQIFLDNGAQRTFITQHLVQKLQLSTEHTEELLIHSFGSVSPQQKTVNCVSFDILLHDGSTMVIEAATLPHLTKFQTRPPLCEEDQHYIQNCLPLSYFADDVPFSSLAFQPDVIVGSDYFWDFMLNSNKIKLPSGSYLIPSKVGLLLGGRHILHSNSTNNAFPVQISCIMNQAILEINHFQSEPSTDTDLLALPNVEDFWALESIGIMENPQIDDDEAAFSQFLESVTFAENRYFVKWPIKTDLSKLPENKALAFRRFQLLANRFRQDSTLLDKYNQIIQEQCKNGIIEPVSDEHEVDHAYHYLPHHPVITPTKATTKVRVVYDGSAKPKDGLSLNECLYRGPVILPDLCGLLLRFRLSPIGIVSDVEKAFLQIGLQPHDRDLTRFFWFRDPSNPTVEGNVQIFRFCRVAFGIISSPFLLAATIRHHLANINNWVSELVLQSIYVDNVIVAVNTTEDATEFYQTAKHLFSTASMNLREWQSNSKALMDTIPTHDQAKSLLPKILGLTWNISHDSFLFKGPSMKILDAPITKRSILKSVASIFDPLGLVSPITLLGKLFIQQLWQMNFGWDDQLSVDLSSKWQNILSNLEELSTIEVSRYLQTDLTADCELHAYVDASQHAYAVAVYLKQHGQVQLIFSKTRLAPKKQSLTIPRLELLSILIGCRVLNFLVKQLSIQVSQCFLWTDSECCLHWLTSTRILAKFIKNRVVEIHQLQANLGNLAIRYINTCQNPADLATRGLNVGQLKSSIWWNGPDWLTSESDEWPQHYLPPITSTLLEQIESEYAKQSHPIQTFSVTTNQSYNPLNINLEKFSSLRKLLNVTVYSLRFLKCLLPNNFQPTDHFLYELLIDIKRNGPIHKSELETAKLYWQKCIQSQYFEEVLKALHKPSEAKPTLINQLGLYSDEHGIIRCQGHYSYAELPKTIKFPVLLPRKSHFTKLVIWHFHVQTFHSGVQHTLATLRSVYWLPSGRTIIRGILTQCTICKSIQGGPYALPPMAPLPVDRMNQARPFQYSGLDYLGPIWYKLNDERCKSWICLFTCLVTRATHLEFVFDMTAKEFLNALRRFFARRGVPHKILSDNASQFQLTKDTLQLAWRQMLTSDDVTTFVNATGITWKMTTPFAPWEGGIYERMVGLTKTAMKKAVGRKLLTLTQLLTLLPEIEAILNSRPLTYVYEGIDSPMVLRPIDFLLPRGSLDTPSSEEDPKDPDWVPKLQPTSKLLKYWYSTQTELEKFWNFWREEYLASLRERTQLKHKGSRVHTDATPQIGDVVLIFQENLPRGAWKIGRIKKVIHSKDNRIRSAEVSLANKTVISRPINHLYPVEFANQMDYAHITTTQMPPDQVLDTQNSSTHNLIPHTESNRQSKPRNLSISMVTICLFTCLFCYLPGTLAYGLNPKNVTYQICAHGRNGHAVSLPKFVHCNLPHNAPLVKHTVELWVQRQIPIKTSGFYCYLQTHSITTHTSFVGGKGLLSDSTFNFLVSADVCRNVVKFKKWNQQPLHEITTGFWSTNNTLNVEYKWCCYSHQNSVTNFILEIGEIASLNGHTIISDLHDLSHCLATTGYCQDIHQGTTIWNATIFKHQCKYMKFGKYHATQSGNALIIEHIQGAFSYTGQPHPVDSNCVPSDAFYTDQGATFIHFTNSTPLLWYALAEKADSVTKDNEEMEDPENYKGQYLYEKIQEIEQRQFKMLWQQLCAVRQTQLQFIWQLLRLDVTLGMRALLGRDDIYGKWAGEAALFWECRNVTPHQVFWSGQINNTCYKYTPVRLSPGSPLFFVSPGSRDLVDSSPIEQCQHTNPHLFQSSTGQWFSAHGAVQVTTIPMELTWKGLWKAFTFHAPSLFINSLNHLPIVPDIHHQLTRLTILETSMHHLINYTAELSLNPSVIHNALSGVGEAIGHIAEGNGKALGHLVSGIADGVGSLANNLLKGPLQLIFNILILLVILIILGFVGYKTFLYLRLKRKKHPNLNNSSIESYKKDEHIEIQPKSNNTPVILELENEPESTNYSLRYH